MLSLQLYILMMLVWLIQYLNQKIFPVILYTQFSGFLQYDAVYIDTYVAIFRGNVFRVA
jgi:hypothetical protein